MRHTRLISAAVGALFFVTAATGCSDAKDALDKGKDLKDKAGDLKSQADGLKDKGGDLKGKAGDMAGKLSPEMKQKIGAALGDKLPPQVKKKLEGTLEEHGITMDAGDKAKDPKVSTAETYFAARQAAIYDNDFAAVKKVANPAMTKRAQQHVKTVGPKQKDKPFKITLVSTKGNMSQVCVGIKGTNPRAVTVKNNKVVNIKPGKFSCK